MKQILTLPPGRAPKQETAKRPSKTLGEHAEAFKSRNGYEVEPPPDTSGEIQGIIAEIMQFRTITLKEANEAGRLISIASQKKLSLGQGKRMVLQAMGYVDHQDMANRTEDLTKIENLNFDRKDLNAIQQEITAEKRAQIERVKAQIRPYFDRVFALPRELEWFPARGKERSVTTGQWINDYARPYIEHLGWEIVESEEFWGYAHALAFRYPHACNQQVKINLFRPEGSGTRTTAGLGSRRVCYEGSRELAREIGWGPKKGEIQRKPS